MAMIRPATITSIVLFCALGLLVVSILSTPIIKGIPLAENREVSFGVFGYCWAKGARCTSIQLGYTTVAETIGGTRPNDFNLSSKTRITLSKLLVVHPVAALFTLILLVMTVSTHFHGPAHSPRFLLLILLVSIATFLVTLLALLVDILLFIPHLAFGAWLVLAAVVCVGISFLALCTTRRRVVSQEARRRRNAEANTNAPTPGFKIAPTVPFADQGTTPGSGQDKLPEFATFDVDKPANDDDAGERIPLNPRHQSPPPPGIGMGREPGDDPRQGGFTRTPTTASTGSNDRYRGSHRAPSDPRRNISGAPLPPSHRLPLNNQYPNPPLPFNGPGPGYGPRGQGARGPPPPPAGFRGGPGGPPYGPRGPPPPQIGFEGSGPYAQGPPPRGNGTPFRDDYGVGVPIIPRGASPGMMGPRPGQGPGPRRGPPPPPQGYFPGGPIDRGYGFGAGEAGEQYGAGRQRQPAPQYLGPHGPASDTQSDDDSRVDTRTQNSRDEFLPQGLAPGPGGRSEDYENGNGAGDYRLERSLEGPNRVNSLYQDGGDYVPPRAGWQQPDGPAELPTSPDDEPSSVRRPTLPNIEEQRSQEAVPQVVELPGEAGVSRSVPGNRPQSTYYEDVDPRFVTTNGGGGGGGGGGEGVPSSLVPGYVDERRRPSPVQQQQPFQPPPQAQQRMMNNRFNTGNNTSFNTNGNQYENEMYGGGGRGQASTSRGLPPPQNTNYRVGHDAYEDPNDTVGVMEGHGQQIQVPYGAERGGDGSPASDTFTSISQRPINPRYLQQQESERTGVLLSGPDFELPVGRSGGRGRGGGSVRGRAVGPGIIPQGLGRDRGPYTG